MNIMMPQMELVARVRAHGQKSLAAGQVGRRLDSLLPKRLKELAAARRDGRRAGQAERLALADTVYCGYIDELVTVRATGREARVQYETHLMLLEARRSLRALAR